MDGKTMSKSARKRQKKAKSGEGAQPKTLTAPPTRVINLPKPAPPPRTKGSNSGQLTKGARKVPSTSKKQVNQQFAAKRRGLSYPASLMLEAITLPKQAKPLRIGSDYGSDPTACTAVFQEPNVAFTQTGPGALVTQAGDVQAWVFRSALRSSIIQYIPPYSVGDTVEISYSAFQALDAGSAGDFTDAAYFAPVAFRSDAVSPGPLSPHGEFLYPGVLGPSDPFRGFWCDYGAQIQVGYQGALAPGANIHVKPYVLIDSEWTAVPAGFVVNTMTPIFSHRNILGDGFPDSSKTGGCYIAFKTYCDTDIPGDANTLVDINFNWSLDGAHNSVLTAYAHQSLPDLDLQVGVVDAIRIIGASLMFTNTSAAVARQGQTVGLQCDPKTRWNDRIGYTSVSTGTRKHVAFEDSEGMYGFLKPNNDADFDWTNELRNGQPRVTVSGPDNVSYAAFLIFPPSGYLTICVSAQSTYNRTGYWTMAFSLEYQTQDQWRDLDLPIYKMEALKVGASLVTDCNQWHQNFPHISEIWDWIKGAASSVANAIVDYGPTILKGAAMVAPLLL